MNIGYLFLALNVLASVGFGHIIKWSQRGGANLVMIGAVNYGVGALLTGAIAIVFGSGGLTPPTVGFATIAGLSYGISYLVYLRALRLFGVGITTTAARLTVMPAVAASILYWGEQPSVARLAGIVIASLALPLLTLRVRPTDIGRAGSGSGWLWLTSMFLIISVTPLVAKAFQESGLSGAQPVFVAVWFTIACLVGSVVGLYQRLRPTRDDLVIGSILGLANGGGTLAMMFALSWLPASVLFPIATAGAVVVAVVSGAWVWGEKLSRPAWAGVFLATVSLLLVNL